LVRAPRSTSPLQNRARFEQFRVHPVNRRRSDWKSSPFRSFERTGGTKSMDHLRARFPKVAPVLAATSLALASGCFDTHHLPAIVPDVGDSTEALIGPEGGELELADVRVRIPAHALSEPAMIHVDIEEAVGPAGFKLYSPVVRLSAPHGVELNQAI